MVYPHLMFRYLTHAFGFLQIRDESMNRAAKGVNALMAAAWIDAIGEAGDDQLFFRVDPQGCACEARVTVAGHTEKVARRRINSSL